MPQSTILNAKGKTFEYTSFREEIAAAIVLLFVLSLVGVALGIAGYAALDSFGVFDKQESVVVEPTAAWECTPQDATWTTSVPKTATTNFHIQPSEPLVEGNCVDIACAILFIMERNYPAMDRVQVAVSQSHCQVVLDDLGQKRYLELHDGRSVYEGTSDFSPMTELLYVSPDNFKAAVAYYRPSISFGELLAYLETNEGDTP